MVVLLLLRAGYLAASALILVLQAIPALRSRFMAYGSRAPPLKTPAETPATALDGLLDYAASFQVPHNYFTHFYAISVASSVFWGWRQELWGAGGKVRMAWLLMLLQGMRRLLESHVYTATSRSQMWFAHWMLGCLFYLATNIAIWIEFEVDGACPLGWEAIVLVPAILAAHYLQHSYHAYLYRLRTQNQTYQLPSHPLFPNLLCPHYTCEVAIYALLSFLAAPRGRMVNWSLMSASVFVLVNLGVTAVGTKEWYADKFGQSQVSGRKRMIPWLW
ncbi:hypothetical protein P280DRAFT_510975 [Massarina eburnea CBS 473.64]|uniref:Polyprenal reductase n=1 Tax=Massarina eburnea CBS 473.64 TaxID=1395130 RepID=A0A6A6RKI8_9PLEO|nr:hypothetical protein P280DRAFT_510975 [Massarina eburnea CBS 473.64]